MCSSDLVIPDYDSHFQENSIIVEMDENKRINVREGVVDISNSIFDGQSLIDISILGKYDKYGMVLLRNRFFKSCCFNTNLQEWFRENNSILYLLLSLFLKYWLCSVPFGAIRRR